MISKNGRKREGGREAFRQKRRGKKKTSEEEELFRHILLRGSILRKKKRHTCHSGEKATRLDRQKQKEGEKGDFEKKTAPAIGWMPRHFTRKKTMFA